MDPTKKTLWKEPKSRIWSFYCPVCKTQRTLPFHPKPGGARAFFQLILTAGFVTLLGWQWMSWKGIFSFFPLWAAYEFFYRTRVRARIACPHCGFDPFLYMVDANLAKKEIENYWRKVFAEKGIPFPEKPAHLEAAQSSALRRVDPPNA